MKNWKMTEECIVNVFGVKLFRVELVVTCKWGSIGDKGGFIEKETNLSPDAWVSGNAQVFDSAKVFGNAWVCDNARVYDSAKVFGNAYVSDNAKVSGNAQVRGKACYL